MLTIVLGSNAFEVAPLTLKQLRFITDELKKPEPAPSVAKAKAIYFATLNTGNSMSGAPDASPASLTEFQEAFAFIMRLSGLAKSSEPHHEASAGVAEAKVKIGDHEYEIPSLAPEKLEAVRSLPVTGGLEQILRDVHAIMSPTYPELTRERLEELLDLPRAQKIILANVAAQMDFTREALRRPSGKA
jgi:hypothetical protein